MSEVKEGGTAEAKIIPKVKTPPRSGKTISISDAVVVDEKKPEANTVNNKETVDSNYANNLQDQKTVNLGDVGKKQDEGKVVIDFMNTEHIESFTSAETKKTEDKKNESSFEGKNIDDLKAEIKKAEEDSTKNFTSKDFEDIARFIIFLIDTGLSSGLKWWSGDSSDTAYSLPEKKKEMLVYQLTLILVKYQAKFSIEFMFILTIIILYAPAFVKAKSKRKETKNINTDLNYNEQAEQFSNIEDIISKAGESKIVEVKKPTRKRGNPGKA